VSRDKTNSRDYAILAVIALAVAVGYFLFRTPPMVPTAERHRPQQQQQQVPHNDMAGTSGSLQFPQDYESLVAMGNRYMDQQEYTIAAESYRRALALNEDTDVRVDFGTCLHGMGLSGRALEEFRKVLEARPDHAIANFNMAVVSYATGQADSSRVYAKRYLTLEPDGRAAPTARELLEILDSES
jgi:tetratricopeptide (TPR) repeat protein